MRMASVTSKRFVSTIAAGVIAGLLLTATVCSGEGLEKGNLFGVHVITVRLRPHVTLDQFKDFFVTRVLPEYEKQWVGLKGYLVKSRRGEYKNRFAIVWLFTSEAARNRYFTADDKPNALEKAAYKGVGPIEEELKQYGTYTIAYKDDWIVQ
jgi:hypothetical protein